MRIRRALLALPLLTVIVTAGVCMHMQRAGAANAELMQKEADHLIEVNSEVLKQLGSLPKNGHVTLSADVVQTDGKVDVRIGHIDTQTADAPGKTTAIREEHIPLTPAAGDTYVRFGKVIETGTVAEHANTSAACEARTLEILKAHPNAKLRELSPAEIAGVPEIGKESPSGAAVIYW